MMFRSKKANQPDISKLKSINEKIIAENELLRNANVNLQAQIQASRIARDRFSPSLVKIDSQRREPNSATVPVTCYSVTSQARPLRTGSR